MYTNEELQTLTSQWGADRKITINGNILTQTVKFGEEMGELFENSMYIEPTKDAIGDMTVVLSNIADLNGNVNLINAHSNSDVVIKQGHGYELLVTWFGYLCKAAVRNDHNRIDHIVGGIVSILKGLCADLNISFNECWNIAYNEIKDRKGELLPNGNFVKESDLASSN